MDDDGKERPLTLADLDVIENAIVKHRPASVVVDPIIAYVGDKDTHKAAQVRSLTSCSFGRVGGETQNRDPCYSPSQQRHGQGRISWAG